MDNFSLNKVNWEQLYVELLAHAHAIIKGLTWFRGKSDSTIMGKEAHDYVLDAIERYLDDPTKYDPTSGRSLKNYLKKHVLRTLIGNDAKSAENRSSYDIFKSDEIDGEFYEKIIPSVNAYIESGIDCSKVMIKLRDLLANDKIAESIFESRYIHGQKRSEIIIERGLTEGEYNNGIRRLDTIIEKMSSFYKY